MVWQSGIYNRGKLTFDLDTAIRRAQRYQLDLGQNSREDVTDEEYLEWRQLWLTVISFDRYVKICLICDQCTAGFSLHITINTSWVAIFLGRLPHIKESISRDRIFKVILKAPLLLFYALTKLGYIFRTRARALRVTDKYHAASDYRGIYST